MCCFFHHYYIVVYMSCYSVTVWEYQ
jgi:hypothetical protein